MDGPLLCQVPPAYSVERAARPGRARSSAGSVALVAVPLSPISPSPRHREAMDSPSARNQVSVVFHQKLNR